VLEGVFVANLTKREYSFVRFEPDGSAFGPVAVHGGDSLEMIVRSVLSWLDTGAPPVNVPASTYRLDQGAISLTPPQGGGYQGVVIDPDTLSLSFRTYARVRRPALVDLNVAERHVLRALPGMSPARVEKLIAHRTTSGPFTSIDELRRIRGFGPKLVDQLRTWATATVGRGSEPGAGEGSRGGG
jgi:hypothetical protein